jgi:hypothetical protein
MRHPTAQELVMWYDKQRGETAWRESKNGSSPWITHYLCHCTSFTSRFTIYCTAFAIKIVTPSERSVTLLSKELTLTRLGHWMLKIGIPSFISTHSFQLLQTRKKLKREPQTKYRTFETLFYRGVSNIAKGYWRLECKRPRVSPWHV